MSIMNPASVVKIVNGATQALKSTLRRAAFLNLLPFVLENLCNFLPVRLHIYVNAAVNLNMT